MRNYTSESQLTYSTYLQTVYRCFSRGFARDNGNSRKRIILTIVSVRDNESSLF